ncbi:ATP-dependent endonuclease [Bacillus sp. S/N-304-OC-R1]|uniref:ATP-dependent nuclease n=1 Tax=Bacillus sp. S/N-304-OC-R1 TaxID=2758034 RepID=UPI001C8EBF33|nr:ATP-binding protein [Bacillus sp. S/N-304-OC-R1]MBY0124402.1 ATP-binding protein [Bacillus sp. S/N-304-OC-R1]
MAVYELEQITFENYRSLQKGDLYINKFNIVIGPNNVGKSNIFRLLKSVINIIDEKHNITEDFKVLTFNLEENRFKKLDFWDPQKTIEVTLSYSNGLSIYFNIDSQKMHLALCEEGEEINFSNFNNKYYQDYIEMLEDIKLSFNFFDDLRGTEEYLKGLDIQKTIIEAIDNPDDEDARQNAGYYPAVSHPLRRILNDKSLWVGKNFKKGEVSSTDFRMKEHLYLSEELDNFGKQRLSTEKIKLKLSAVGSGVAQVISILTILYKYKKLSSKFKYILLIEEPEQNLHPHAVVRLFNILKEENNIQFIVNTHSPWLIDDPDVSKIYNIDKNKKDGSVIKQIRTASEMRSMLDLIGAKPSHLLQSNLVIWVEGPSDRIYINAWMKLTMPSMVEGKHYSFVMYGGSLLSHYGYDDNLINLLSTSRYAVLVSDLDRTNPDDDVKERLATWEKRFEDDESIKNNIMLWKTDYKEIENYIPHEELSSAINSVKMQDKVRVEVSKGLSKNIKVSLCDEGKGKFNSQQESFTEFFSGLYKYNFSFTDDIKKSLNSKGVVSGEKVREEDIKKMKNALNAVKIDIAKIVVKNMVEVPPLVKHKVYELKEFLDKSNLSNGEY